MDKQAIIKALRDTAQSASNSVAETASAPIDAITWALRKAGLPVPENAVGSSDWMAQKGLTAPVEAGIPKMAGEVLGNVVPAIGFAKAPQIARGINRMVDNAMAPTTLNKQRGVIGVHHQDVLNSMSKGLSDDVVNESFGVDGYVYHTPYRPFENSQQTAIGVKANPISERIFSTESPLTASQLKSIEALPASENSALAFSKELADEGAFSFMNKDGKRFSIVMPSSKNSGQFQATQYDPRGAIGDSQHQTQADAIKRLIENGYSRILDESRAEKMLNQVMLK